MNFQIRIERSLSPRPRVAFKCARRRLPALAGAMLLSLIVAGCVSTGPDAARLAATPIPAGKARLTITRTNALLYVAAPAKVTLNGEKVADLSVGGSHVVDLPAGENVIAVSLFVVPGKFTVRLAAKAGERYAVEVAPREASYAPIALLGVVGAAIDASVNENAGAFQMRFIRPSGSGA